MNVLQLGHFISIQLSFFYAKRIKVYSIIFMLVGELIWGIFALFILNIANDYFVNVVLIIIFIGITVFIPSMAIEKSIKKSTES